MTSTGPTPNEEHPKHITVRSGPFTITGPIGQTPTTAQWHVALSKLKDKRDDILVRKILYVIDTLRPCNQTQVRKLISDTKHHVLKKLEELKTAGVIRQVGCEKPYVRKKRDILKEGPGRPAEAFYELNDSAPITEKHTGTTYVVGNYIQDRNVTDPHMHYSAQFLQEIQENKDYFEELKAEYEERQKPIHERLALATAEAICGEQPSHILSSDSLRNVIRRQGIQLQKKYSTKFQIEDAIEYMRQHGLLGTHDNGVRLIVYQSPRESRTASGGFL